TAQNCSGQWLVVSGQRRRFTYFRVESGLDMAPLLPEVQESSRPYWDAPAPTSRLSISDIADRMWTRQGVIVH
ncbi:MAG: hypothetical protein OXK78_03365, partial [Caldilineaceae bacterium]|nr:hypothetical protein [Caldilineaceae bacterium]